MAARRRQTKKITKGQITGQKGENLIERIVLDMEFVWRSIGSFDAGIDGRIELRDVRTEELLHREVRVQSKGYAQFTRETDACFEFLCDPADIDYWMRCPEPVVLLCSHPEQPDSKDVWFRCVTEWFADAGRRADRRIFFDKQADRFDASAAPRLMSLAASHQPATPSLAPPPPEAVLSNLFPIIEHSQTIWSAPTDLRTRDDIRQRYEQGVSGTWARDLIIKSKRLYALRDPRTRTLADLCDTKSVESFAADDWAHSSDPALRRNWTELLQRALLHQMRHQLRWHPKEHVFHFPAPDPLTDLSIDGPNGPRQVIKVEYYRLKDDETEPRLKYVRHHAFRPSFEFIDGCWHLAVEPDYLFTFDGHRPSFRADEFMAGIKKLERNAAVRGHLRLWQHVLSPPPSLFPRDADLLTFDAPVTLQLPIGIDDSLWAPKQADGTGKSAGQDQLAA